MIHTKAADIRVEFPADMVINIEISDQGARWQIA